MLGRSEAQGRAARHPVRGTTATHTKISGRGQFSSSIRRQFPSECPSAVDSTATTTTVEAAAAAAAASPLPRIPEVPVIATAASNVRESASARQSPVEQPIEAPAQEEIIRNEEEAAPRAAATRGNGVGSTSGVTVRCRLLLEATLRRAVCAGEHSDIFNVAAAEVRGALASGRDLRSTLQNSFALGSTLASRTAATPEATSLGATLGGGRGDGAAFAATEVDLGATLGGPSLAESNGLEITPPPIPHTPSDSDHPVGPDRHEPAPLVIQVSAGGSIFEAPASWNAAEAMAQAALRQHEANLPQPFPLIPNDSLFDAPPPDFPPPPPLAADFDGSARTSAPITSPINKDLL